MRAVNRFAAALLGLALAVSGVVLVSEAAMIWLDKPPLVVPRDGWYAALTATSFSATSVLTVSLVALVAGLLLLIVQLRPWRPVRLAARFTGWYLRRGAAQRSVAAAVNRVPAVAAAHAKLGKGWRLTVKAAADNAEREAVHDAVVAELDRLAAFDTSRVRVRLTRRRVV